MNPRIIWAIFCRDMLDAIKNTYILFALIMPVGMSLLFSVMLPAKQYADPVLHVVAYDQGQSQVMQKLGATPGVDLKTADSIDQVKDQVTQGSSVGMILPQDFDGALAAGRYPEILLYYNSDKTVGTQATLGGVLEDILREIAGQELPAKLVSTDVLGPDSGSGIQNFNVTNYMLILFLAMGLVMTGVFVVPTILVEEKEKQTLQAILVSPASYADLVAGKALVGMVYALLSAFILLAMNGGFSGMAAVTVSAVVLGASFLVLTGLLLGAIFKTTAQVNMWSSIVMLALLFPAMFALMPKPPEPIPAIMHLIPTNHVASAISAGLDGSATLAGAGVDLLILAVCSAAVFFAVIWILRRERR
jgi:ABC-2 type transport system permease protein